MIRLRQIKKNDDIISCLAYIEDKDPGVFLSFNLRTGEETIKKLPDEYIRPPEHIRMAFNYIESIKEKDSFPDSKLIMWY